MQLKDIILKRRHRERGLIVLAEVSSDLDRDDVLHAADRAAMLAKLGSPVLPAVAGNTITERAAAIAHSRHVWQILDGHAIEPPAGATGHTLTEHRHAD